MCCSRRCVPAHLWWLLSGWVFPCWQCACARICIFMAQSSIHATVRWRYTRIPGCARSRCLGWRGDRDRHSNDDPGHNVRHNPAPLPFVNVPTSLADNPLFLWTQSHRRGRYSGLGGCLQRLVRDCATAAGVKRHRWSSWARQCAHHLVVRHGQHHGP